MGGLDDMQRDAWAVTFLLSLARGACDGRSMGASKLVGGGCSGQVSISDRFGFFLEVHGSFLFSQGGRARLEQS